MKKADYLFRTDGERHAEPTLLSNFILGSQDGLVNVLGIVLGVSAATSELRIVFVAALAALGAESISMGAVAYTSTLARRRHYLKEIEREKSEMKEIPKVEREEVRSIFSKWGYRGDELELMTEKICKNRKAWLEFMMAHELNLSPVKENEARRSFSVVLLATIFGSIIPILPFLFTGSIHEGIVASVILSAITLFVIGYYEAKVTIGSLWRSGLEMLMIGMAAGIAGYLIGYFVGAVPV
ncbi:MAG: VIT1/CCC1 transporter family protein [Candidatus Micrarchaeales archaeon]|nr:VIT1/CCC1 transporter family protein [Candidatus Micrarchaeales archaeon]